MVNTRRLLVGTLLLALAAGSGCSTAKKTTPELSEMRGKKVALVEIDGETTARRVVEVALINQLLKRGSFEIVSKQDLERARQDYRENPADWQGIGRRCGADYAIRAKVLEFDADERTGYSKEKVEDSQLEAETGNAETERLYKVKSLEGKVRVQMDFAKLAEQDLRSGIAEHSDKVVVEARTKRAELPPRLRFLETVSNEAFRKFFDQYE
ncbi:MAG TPA: hypothetical protein VM598_12170 [Bdellovibrionota bacterium]|nr:hypothetical protein [Bdellovibrionota bacterium]